MHCRRVRSYLSAFSNDELTGAVLREVREHLSNCRECRSEEAVYRSVRLATKQLPSRHLSADFNARILDRVAKERFAETRNKAYLPKAAPSILWRRLVPVLSSAAVIALVAIGVAQFKTSNGSNLASLPAPVEIGQINDYLTVQPLARDWSLDNHLAQTDRISNLTSSMTQPFDRSASLAGSRSSTNGVWVRDPRLPGMIFLYRVRPVVRTNNSTAVNASYKESDKVY